MQVKRTRHVQKGQRWVLADADADDGKVWEIIFTRRWYESKEDVIPSETIIVFTNAATDTFGMMSEEDFLREYKKEDK